MTEEKITLKRYLLFGGDTHYPIGGMNDFAHSSNDLGELIVLGRHIEEVESNWYWWHIYDSATGLIVDANDDDESGKPMVWEDLKEKGLLPEPQAPDEEEEFQTLKQWSDDVEVRLKELDKWLQRTREQVMTLFRVGIHGRKENWSEEEIIQELDKALMM